MKLQNNAVCSFVLSILPMIFSLQAYANQSVGVTLNDEQPYKTIQVTEERHEPIYENQDYQDTCSREVLSHFETQCRTVFEERCSGGGTSCSGGGTVCTTQSDRVCNSRGCVSVPRRVCHQTGRSCHTEPAHCARYPREMCSQRPIYRTEYYSCTRTRTVQVGQRLVKTFKNEITVALGNEDVLKNSQINLMVNVAEANVSVAMNGAFPLAGLASNVKKVSQSEQNNVVTTKIAVAISAPILADQLNKILSASIADLKLSYSKVDLTLKEGASLMNLIKLNMALGQDKPVISDRMKFDGVVPQNAISAATEGNDLRLSINLGTLGVSLKGKKHNLALAASLLDQPLLNKADFSAAFQKSVEQKLQGVYPQ